ncbi:MAG: GNAT family N-acetyltransferase [Eubacterium sp.]|nr:GNAT family N-acetyltransferase [Eubacterium sp.]
MLREHERSLFIVDARNGFEDVKEDVDWGFSYFLPELKKTGCTIWGFILPEVSEIEGEIDLWTKEIEKNFRVIRATSYEEILKQARITYKDIHDFSPEDLQALFLSVEWSSGHFPDRLVIAMKNYETVYTAWDGDKLVGLICAMDDGSMNAYVHYLLVHPDYHKMKIGRTLVQMVKDHYKDYLRLVVIAYDKEIHFYEDCGFEKSTVSTPMFITSLWT